jgi:hypothetical protein
VNGGEPLARQIQAGRLLELRGDDLRRDGRRAGAVALAHLARRRVEHHGVRRHAVARGQRAPAGAPLRVEAGGVDHRHELAGQPLGDDQVEHLERVAARALVALTHPDHRAQPVGGDDLVGEEVLLRPCRLPRRRRADEHDEAGVRQTHRATAGCSRACASGRARAW